MIASAAFASCGFNIAGQSHDLYDSRAKLFVCARDRYGIKPLFFSEVNGSLIIGAEIKALAPLGLDPEWDVQSIADRGYAHDTRTIFKGVHKVRRSGHSH